jgi:hypothetical protein
MHREGDIGRAGRMDARKRKIARSPASGREGTEMPRRRLLVALPGYLLPDAGSQGRFAKPAVPGNG